MRGRCAATSIWTASITSIGRSHAVVGIDLVKVAGVDEWSFESYDLSGLALFLLLSIGSCVASLPLYLLTLYIIFSYFPYLERIGRIVSLRSVSSL
jgi:hypothetical protein